MGLLQQLNDHAQRNPGALPAELAAQLHAACIAVARGCSLERALGYDRSRRNAALRRAGELLLPDGTAWARAGAVLAALDRLHRAGRAPCSEVDEVLNVAIEAAPMPTSQRQLSNILSG